MDWTLFFLHQQFCAHMWNPFCHRLHQSKSQSSQQWCQRNRRAQLLISKFHNHNTNSSTKAEPPTGYKALTFQTHKVTRSQEAKHTKQQDPMAYLGMSTNTAPTNSQMSTPTSSSSYCLSLKSQHPTKHPPLSPYKVIRDIKPKWVQTCGTHSNHHKVSGETGPGAAVA